MKQKSKNVLEFRKIIDKVESFAQTEFGKEKVRKIDAISDLEEVKNMQLETKEAFSMIMEKGNPSFGGAKDITGYARHAALGGCISIAGLLRCADTLRVARQLKNYIQLNRKDERVYKIIDEYAENIFTDRNIEDEIYFAIISEEEVADDASPQLKRIRREIVTKKAQIKNKINSMVNSVDTQKYLQDNIVTIRNDRYVLPVRSEYKSMVKGMVHDQSSTGATLFVEPIAIVEMNNVLATLKIEEKKEIERILYNLSAMIAEIEGPIKLNKEILTDLDYIFAKGGYAISINAIMPELNDKGNIRIKNGRHPLIDKNTIVPTNVWVGNEFTQLIITGPNTGGKTVTLKTLGLFTLMAMAGLHVPADYGTILSTFDAVYADIGDEQSIEQSLSTFSSHMTNIVKIMNEVTNRSFVLFDELGAGTDPDEGAALAMSILDTLRERKIVTAATTHYSELKLYALTNEGVCNGSVEFSIETLSPTYKVLIGIPGKSNAFAISKKIGLGDNIIDKAKAMIKKDTVAFEDVLNKIDSDRKYIELKRIEIDNLKLEQEKITKDVLAKERKIKEKNDKIINEANYEARKILDTAKKETTEIIKDLKQLNLDMDAERSRKAYELRQNLNNKLKSIDDALFDNMIVDIDDDEDEVVDKVIKNGDYVLVRTLNQKGYVINIDNSKCATVQIGLLKMKVKLIDLVKTKSDEEKQQTIKTGKMLKLRTKSVKPSIDLRGKNLEEALMDIDKYLDDAFMSGLNEVQLIHGKGTGILREGIKKYLKTYKHVKEFRIGKFNEGGDGVTIVSFK
ncbi:endonuclease MutS2 [Sedimentibacter sp. zth1]|uniref:endonuclease MutS2 n=1 Tax=Sedimentibacter sp. zth1 TaxID=2816908 RepID=UPI001A92E016|nr:endonuclease MutS2 [Sedimentibacter sp. zth1]QSX07105.1 endonuclease MutS2 [Sedimentibacter sp. zth1]